MGETVLKCAQLLVTQKLGHAISSILGPHSFTFGVSGGSNTYAMAVTAALGRPGAVVIKSDVAQAFPSLSRNRLFDQLSQHHELKAVWPLVSLMYGGHNFITFRGPDGSVHRVRGEEGGRQGDPWFSWLHDIAYRPILDDVEDQFPGVIALNYADDPCFIGPAATPAEAQALAKAYVHFQDQLRDKNRQVVRSGSQLYVPPGTASSIGQDGVANLAQLLNILPDHVSSRGIVVGGIAIGADEFVSAHAASTADGLLTKLEDIVHAKQQNSSPQLCTAQACAALIRAVVLPSFTHIIRGHDPRSIIDACRNVDDAAFSHFLSICCIRGQAGEPLEGASRARFFLPLRLSGLGMQSASQTAAAAYVGQWACGAQVIDTAINLSEDGSGDYLCRTNAAAKRLAAQANRALRLPPDDFDDFGEFGVNPSVPGQYSVAPRDLPAEERNHPGARCDLNLIPGLREAWAAVAHAHCVEGLTPFHFLTDPRRQLQKDLSVDLGRQRYDTLSDAVTEQQRAQIVESTSGLLRFAFGCFPVFPENRIADRPYLAVVRDFLFLGPRDLSDSLFVAAGTGACRRCGRDPVDTDEAAALPDCGHAYVTGKSCPKLQPHRSRLSSRLQQACTALRRAAGLLDPVDVDRDLVPDRFRRSIDMDRLNFARQPSHPGGRVYCDDSWVLPDGTIQIADVTICCSCVKPGALAGHTLDASMSKKLLKYRTAYIITDADQRHLVFSGFGQMHRDTALYIKQWARDHARSTGRPPSVTISRALERLGCTILIGLGDSLSDFALSCAPHPEHPAAHAALGRPGGPPRPPSPPGASGPRSTSAATPRPPGPHGPQRKWQAGPIPPPPQQRPSSPAVSTATINNHTLYDAGDTDVAPEGAPDAFVQSQRPPEHPAPEPGAAATADARATLAVLAAEEAVAAGAEAVVAATRPVPRPGPPVPPASPTDEAAALAAWRSSLTSPAVAPASSSGPLVSGPFATGAAIGVWLVAAGRRSSSRASSAAGPSDSPPPALPPLVPRNLSTPPPHLPPPPRHGVLSSFPGMVALPDPASPLAALFAGLDLGGGSRG